MDAINHWLLRDPLSGRQNAGPPDVDEKLSSLLTERELEVIELLSQHKTSKEIALELGISRYTVDDYVKSASGKLGTANRRELALAYRTLKGPPEQLGAQKSGVAAVPDQAELDGGHHEVFAAETEQSVGAGIEKRDYRVVPEMFEGPYRTYARLGAIAVATLVILLIALAGMAVFSEALSVASEFFTISP